MDAKSAVEHVSKIVLKDKQEEAITAVLEGSDVFAVLPTGNP